MMLLLSWCGVWAHDSMFDRKAEGTGTVDVVLIKIAVIIVSLLVWLALIFMAERQARRKRAGVQAAEPTEASRS